MLTPTSSGLDSSIAALVSLPYGEGVGTGVFCSTSPASAVWPSAPSPALVNVSSSEAQSEHLRSVLLLKEQSIRRLEERVSALEQEKALVIQDALRAKAQTHDLMCALVEENRRLWAQQTARAAEEEVLPSLHCLGEQLDARLAGVEAALAQAKSKADAQARQWQLTAERLQWIAAVCLCCFFR
jgi:hypothetical protein